VIDQYTSIASCRETRRILKSAVNNWYFGTSRHLGGSRVQARSFFQASFNISSHLYEPHYNYSLLADKVCCGYFFTRQGNVNTTTVLAVAEPWLQWSVASVTLCVCLSVCLSVSHGLFTKYFGIFCFQNTVLFHYLYCFNDSLFYITDDLIDNCRLLFSCVSQCMNVNTVTLIMTSVACLLKWRMTNVPGLACSFECFWRVYSRGHFQNCSMIVNFKCFAYNAFSDSLFWQSSFSSWWNLSTYPHLGQPQAPSTTVPHTPHLFTWGRDERLLHQ